MELQSIVELLLPFMIILVGVAMIIAIFILIVMLIKIVYRLFSHSGDIDDDDIMSKKSEAN